jgi:hypothetical protein
MAIYKSRALYSREGVAVSTEWTGDSVSHRVHWNNALVNRKTFMSPRGSLGSCPHATHPSSVFLPSMHLPEHTDSKVIWRWFRAFHEQLTAKQPAVLIALAFEITCKGTPRFRQDPLAIPGHDQKYITA